MAVALVSLFKKFCFTFDRTKDVLRWTSRVVLLPAGRGAALTGRNRPLISGKSGLVKYYDLARIIGATEKSFRIIQRNGDLFGQIEGR